jgi:hypothetical protein
MVFAHEPHHAGPDDHNGISYLVGYSLYDFAVALKGAGYKGVGLNEKAKVKQFFNGIMN